MRRLMVVALVVTGAGVACARKTAETEAVAVARPIETVVGVTPAPRRAPVSPLRQDTVRKEAMAAVMATIAGRENEPAGQVFKNVKLHRQMPAKEFLTMMDEQYGRGLGMTCTNCHMDNDYASDERKNKVISRQMERMQRDIDAKYIAKVKELDDPRPKVTCVMCHRGTTHMPNTMDVPTTPPVQRKRG